VGGNFEHSSVVQGSMLACALRRSGGGERVNMEQSSNLEHTAPTPTSERFLGRASGTRRIVKAERNTAESEAVTLLPPSSERPQRWFVRALDAGWQLDTRLRGRLLWGAGAVAATSGAALPLLASSDASVAAIRTAGWLSLTALSVAGFLWAARGRPKLGLWTIGHVREQMLDSLRSSLSALPALAHAPKNLRLSLLSRLARVAGFAGLGLSSVLACLELSLGRLAPTLSGACLWGASLLFASQLLSLALRLQTQPARVEASELELALREFPPVVELSSPGELESVFLDPTPLHDVMHGLSCWRDSAGWRTARGCALALQRHLAARFLPQGRLELGRWLDERGADGKADLVVEDCVLVDFQIGLGRENVPHVVERLRGYRQAWGERPIVVVVLPGTSGAVDSAAIEALKAPGDAPRWIVAVAR
jgi:hypothetical protein